MEPPGPAGACHRAGRRPDPVGRPDNKLSVIRDRLTPDYAALHPGYGPEPRSAINTAERYKGIVRNRGAVGAIGRDRAQQGIEKLGYGARLGVAHTEHHAGRVVPVGPTFQ